MQAETRNPPGERTTSDETWGIELSDIWKSFDQTAVLKGIDLSIRPGEFVVLVGQSGCGKSTLLRVIAGLTEHDRGSVAIGGKPVDKVAPSGRGVSMVFQSYALFPHMDVAENIAFPLLVRKLPKKQRQEKAREVAALLGLEELLGRRPAELSGGQRQRVAIGRALAREPQIYLFDEPLSNLDAALRGRMRVELKGLHRKLGRTMVYVTHDQVEAMTLADRIAVLEAGEVQQYGTPEELYRKPRNLFVARFFGTPRMNTLEGVVQGGRFRCGGLEVPIGLPDRRVVLGIRPEDLVVGEEGGFQASVEIIEPVGDRGHLHLDVAGQKLAATIPGIEAFALEPGARLRVGLPPSAIHLFDPVSEMRLDEPMPEPQP